MLTGTGEGVTAGEIDRSRGVVTAATRGARSPGRTATRALAHRGVRRRRPAALIAAFVTLDQAAFARWKRRQCKPANATIADLSQNPDLLAAVREAVDQANTAVSHAEAIKRSASCPAASPSAPSCPQTHKVRRDRVLAKFATDVEALCA